MKAGVERSEFGRLTDGRAVHQYVLSNATGMRLAVIDYGAIVRELWTPDALGESANIVLGFDNLADYVQRNQQFGVIAGRFANRIAQARFTLDGQDYRLDDNDFGNCLHGGSQGFGSQLWQAVVPEPDGSGGASLLLRYVSADGEMGFPGEMEVLVRYSLGPTNAWRIDYEARTNKPTVVNLCSHAYFNLAGGGNALDHELMLFASRYTETDELRIPTRHASVEGTRYDFRRSKPVADASFDHNWLLDHPLDGQLHPAARLLHRASGRVMELRTTEPCVQFYAGKWLDGSLRGSSGETYEQGYGLCLETQHAPDSPNREIGPEWPSTVLRPGQVFRSSTVHRFGVQT